MKRLKTSFFLIENTRLGRYTVLSNFLQSHCVLCVTFTLIHTDLFQSILRMGTPPCTPGCILPWEDIVPATSQALCFHPRRIEGLEFSNCQVFSIHSYRLQVWRPPICPTCLEPKLASGSHGPISSFPTNFILGTVFLMLSLRALLESP